MTVAAKKPISKEWWEKLEGGKTEKLNLVIASKINRKKTR